jgi:hypothetical protein
MNPKPAPQQLTFQSRLERIASGAEYYALSVPAQISRILGTAGPVPVAAQVNDSTPFQLSLFPIGGGRHYLRVKASVRNEVKIKEGDRVRVEITVVDRDSLALPEDLLIALRVAGAEERFMALSPGKRHYTVRWIDEAARPETRAKRIQTAVDAARAERGK